LVFDAVATENILPKILFLWCP